MAEINQTKRDNATILLANGSKLSTVTSSLSFILLDSLTQQISSVNIGGTNKYGEFYNLYSVGKVIPVRSCSTVLVPRILWRMTTLMENTSIIPYRT